MHDFASWQIVLLETFKWLKYVFRLHDSEVLGGVLISTIGNNKLGVRNVVLVILQ